MKLRRALAIVLSLSVILSINFTYSINVKAEKYDVFTYTLSNGTITITGCDKTATGDKVIPGSIGGYPVVAISNAAFYNCKNITSVKVPDNVVNIGDFAFFGCDSLVSVVLPRFVKNVGDYAFYNCEAFKKIYYTGSELQWANMSLGENNPALVNSNISFKFIYGDVDDDGTVGSLDFALVRKAVFGAVKLDENHPGAFDINCDGLFNVLDLVRIKKNLLDMGEENIPDVESGLPGTPSVPGVGEDTGEVEGGETVNSLDFRGKTFRKTIIGAIPAVTMRRKAAFEKKYNCKLELVSLQWDRFLAQCATAVAAGTPYDICGAQTFFWPEAGVKGLYEPLNKYISQDDLYDAKTGIGIDLEKSNYFALNGNIYAVCNHTGNCADMLSVMFYNKLKFKEAGLEDPLVLYNQGKWTWDKFVEFAKVVNDPGSGTYLVGKDLNVSHFAAMNGWSGVKFVDGKAVENTADPKFLEALKYWQENIIKTDLRGEGGYPSDNYSEILSGNQWMHVQGYTAGTYYMYDGVCSSTAFKNNFKNLGIVPLPMGPSNTEKLYHSGGPQGKAAGKGSSDPRIVIAWTKFDLEFEDPTAAENPTLYDKDTNDMIKKLFDKVVYATPNYKTSAQSVGTLFSNITNEADKKDGNYVQAITANAKNIQAIIDEALGQ